MFRVFAATLILLGLSLTSESSFAQQTGCVVGDCKNGIGTYIFGDWDSEPIFGSPAVGTSYKGGFSDGSFAGRGVLKISEEVGFGFHGGERYEGNFVEGEIIDGTLTYPDDED